MSRRDFRRAPKKRLVVTWKRLHAPNRLRERGVHAKMETPGDIRYTPRGSPGHDFLAKPPSPKRTSSVQDHSMSTKGLFFGNAWRGIEVTQDGELKNLETPETDAPPAHEKSPCGNSRRGSRLSVVPTKRLELLTPALRVRCSTS